MTKSNRIIFIFALIKFSIAFLFIHHEFELQRDEYLYLADARHLAWGFIEMPPVLALLGRISWLFGSSFYAVYFWGALFGALTMVLIGKIVQLFKGNEYAVSIACLGYLVSGFLRMNILFQPNFLDVFFWTLSCYFIVSWINTDDKKFIYYIGICFGLGMLSKYTMAFFIIGFWVGVLLTKQRKWLMNKHFYFAMLIALAIVLPNFLWQIYHHFPVAHHMKLLQRQQLQYLSRVGFLIDQLLNTLPCFFIWLIGLWYLFFTIEGRRHIGIGILYLTIIGLLLIFKGKSYYAMSIYPTLLAIGAAYLEKLTKGKKFARWRIPVVISLLAIPFFPIAVPFASPAGLEKIYKILRADKLGSLKWEDGKNHPLPQDFGDMLGWREMAEKVNDAWQKLDSNEKAHTMIFCDNYGEAGAVNYFGKKYQLPEAFSDNASFLYWLPENQHIDNLILVTDDQQEMQHDFIKDFKSAELSDSITNAFAREKGSLIIILKGGNEKFNQMFRQKILDDKEALK
jgi:Dolichyl-phosphate-mannose-protein mannosyltransferase